MKEADRMTNIVDLISLLLKEQSDMNLHSFVSPISPNTYFLNIRQNIPREKYFDIVSE